MTPANHDRPPFLELALRGDLTRGGGFAKKQVQDMAIIYEIGSYPDVLDVPLWLITTAEFSLK